MRCIFCLLVMVINVFPVFSQSNILDTGSKILVQSIPNTEVTFKMVFIPSGKFTMGSPAAEAGRDADEGPQRRFTISPFWMGATEVTYDEFVLFLRDQTFSQNKTVDAVTRPSQPYLDFSLGMGKEGGYPANSMQQYGALMYCKWLYKKTGIFYRLPTEAEWEYACRAGTNTTYFFGNNVAELSKYAWYATDSEKKTYHQVGLLKPNPWGLYDILGNVGEWTLDQYQANYFDSLQSITTNPLFIPKKRHPRTIKGGTYTDAAKELRAANRLESDPIWNRRDPQMPKSKWWNADAPFIGFRVISPIKQPTEAEAENFFKLYLK